MQCVETYWFLFNPNSTKQGQNSPLPPVFCVLLKKSSLQPIVKLICKFLLHICGDPQALIWAKKIDFGAFLGSQSCLILKITVFANLKIVILGYLEAFFGGKS